MICTLYCTCKFRHCTHHAIHGMQCLMAVTDPCHSFQVRKLQDKVSKCQDNTKKCRETYEIAVSDITNYNSRYQEVQLV